MAINLKAQGGGSSRGRAPTKRTINFAETGKKTTNYLAIIPFVVIFIAIAAAVTKFGIIDPLNEYAAEEAITEELQAKKDALLVEIESYGDLTERYKHYTFSGMSTEELTRADRVLVMGLIDQYLMPNCIVNSWQLSSNTLTLTITTKDPREANMLADQIQRDTLVHTANITSAKSYDTPSDENPEVLVSKCSAKMTVTLKDKQSNELQTADDQAKEGNNG